MKSLFTILFIAHFSFASSGGNSPSPAPLKLCAEIQDRVCTALNSNEKLLTEKIFIWAYLEENEIPRALSFVWKKNDHTVATVPIKVSSKKGRFYSSKTLSPNSAGYWTTELVNQETGKVRSKISFDLTYEKETLWIHWGDDKPVVQKTVPSPTPEPARAVAATPTEIVQVGDEHTKRLSLNFASYLTSYIQSDATYPTPLLAMTPVYLISQRVSLGLELGASLTQDSSQASFTILLAATKLEVETLPRLLVSAAAGIQDYASRGGAYFTIGGGVAYRIEAFGGILHAIRAGYYFTQVSAFPTHQGLLGAEFRLGSI